MNETLTKLLDDATRRSIADAVSYRFRHVEARYIMECFDRYPRAVVGYRKSRCIGVFFYTVSHESNDGYFYFGPLFFFSRWAFAWATLTVLGRYLRASSTLYVLAEIQNPELIMHLHSVFGPWIYPKAFSFAIDEKARKRVATFQKLTPQLDTICVENFCSQSTSTLFYRKRTVSKMEMWLKEHGVDVSNNQALVTLIELNRVRFFLAKIAIAFCLVTYPFHKIVYQKKLNVVVENSLCHR